MELKIAVTINGPSNAAGPYSLGDLTKQEKTIALPEISGVKIEELTVAQVQILRERADDALKKASKDLDADLDRVKKSAIEREKTAEAEKAALARELAAEQPDRT